MRDNSLIQFLVRNLGWMLASLFLALMIWVAANMADNPVEQREMNNLPISVDLPDGFVLVQPRSPSVQNAVIRADRRQWDLIVPADVQISADLTGASEPGNFRIELDAEIAAPLHGNVVALRPSTMTFTIDREAEKRIPVRVVVAKEPPLGYTYPADLTCNQTEVTVRGSSEMVADVDHAEVRLNLGDVRNPIVDQSYDLIAIRSSGRTTTDITLEPPTVICSIDIQPRDNVFQLPVLPRTTGQPPSGYNFEGYSAVEPDTVGLTGDRRAIRDLGGLIRTQSIDLTGKTETFTIEVPVELPVGVSLVPENQLIRVVVTISSQTTTRPYEDVPVEITGLDPTSFQATGLANTVTVFVSGPPNMLPERADLRVVVDLTGLPAGNHQVEPQGMILGQEESSDVTISVSPDLLSVTIEALNPTPTPSPTPTGVPGEGAATPGAASTATPDGRSNGAPTSTLTPEAN